MERQLASNLGGDGKAVDFVCQLETAEEKTHKNNIILLSSFASLLGLIWPSFPLSPLICHGWAACYFRQKAQSQKERANFLLNILCLKSKNPWQLPLAGRLFFVLLK